MHVGETLTIEGEAGQRALGARLAAHLPHGAVLFLEGDLGAGQTTLTQGLMAALGFTGAVNSPTYALMHEYATPQGRALHVDAYRVRHAHELLEMDLERLIEESRVSVIEWGEALYPEYPDAMLLRLAHTGGEARTVTRVR